MLHVWKLFTYIYWKKTLLQACLLLGPYMEHMGLIQNTWRHLAQFRHLQHLLFRCDNEWLKSFQSGHQKKGGAIYIYIQIS